MEPRLLRIGLLGELSLRLGETPLPALDSARAESLLAYLLVHRDAPVPRQRLAFLLWPDSNEQQARTNLRHVLHKLRHALPDADRYLEVTPRALRWRSDAPASLDVAAFEDALERGALQEAADTYTGDLLQGSYDDWVLAERSRLHDRFVDALTRLCAFLEERGEHAEAIRYGERLLRADPLREDTYRTLMRLHDARGDRAKALRTYHACTAALERTLGVEPAARTRAAYEALLPDAPAAETSSDSVVSGLIGRAAERARLTALWRESEQGHARLALVTGEAGIGKSRLVDEFGAWCARRGVAVAEAHSYPAEGSLAFGPVAAWLRSAPLAIRRVRLDPGRLAELARVLPELPGTPQTLPPDEQRHRLFDAITRAITASVAPVLLIADDLHWADRETLHFLHYLLRSEPHARLLVAATVRIEDVDSSHPLNELVSGLRALERVEELHLEPLSQRETAVLAERLTGTSLDEAQTQRLFTETEGNPLFVVETLRAGSSSPRVHAVIEARLAQLSNAARELAGIAATVGREFTSDVLAHASGFSEDALMHRLDELWRRRIVRERGTDAYDFTHDRIREVSYRGLAPAQRRLTHLRVAGALVAVGVDDPAQVALHFDRAGAVEEAVAWYERAADRMLRMRADAEAIRVLERALELVRDPQCELRLTTAIVAPLAMLDGVTSERLTAAQERALALARELALEPDPPLLRSLALTRLAADDFDGARRYGEQLRARAERDGDHVQRVESDYALGVAAFWSGNLELARHHFDAAIAGYRPEHRATHLVRYGLDPQAICMSRLANTLWFLGEPLAARRARDDALALAREVAHPATEGTVFVFAALLGIDSGDEDAVRRFATALEQWCRSHKSRVLSVATGAFAGYVDVLDGRHATGLDRIRRAADRAAASNPAPGNYATSVHILVEACAIARNARIGLATANLPVSTPLWEAQTRRRRAQFATMLAEERSRNAPAAIVHGHDR
ncbi:MAG TPA: AAA family ATPase [Solirubrobacteraceae bacterium]|nr:AAA family ATPase [Solirubrobacteraceae bacterium]